MSDQVRIGTDETGPGWITSREDFARELTRVREKAGLTVRTVATSVGIQHSTVGGYFAGRHLPPLKLHGVLPDILRVCGITDPVTVEQWQEALRRVRRAPGRRPAGAPVPYLGLATFEPEHAEWFHGRGDLTRALLRRVVDQYDNGGPLVVVGPSGSGKSSLLRAGLIPTLEHGDPLVPGSAGWTWVLLTPGEHPLLAWADGVTDAVGKLVIVVDQFEELFTLCRDEDEQRAFLELVCSADAAPGRRVVVLGMRADFYGQALRWAPLVPALQHSQLVVGPMTGAELREVIVEPARRARLDLEDGLVEVLLRDLAPASARMEPDVAHEAGALPLLSHALLVTWQRGPRGRLTLADYRESGGIRDAVARTAETVFEGLDDAQRTVARQVFLRMVQIGDDTADTRRRVPWEELLGTARDLRPAEVRDVLERFVDERLVTVDAETVGITHEALLRAWPRLRSWIDADRAGLRVHRQLTADAVTWRDGGRDPQLLYRGGRLAIAHDWRESAAQVHGLNALEEAYLDASVAHEAAERLAERRRTRRLRQLVAALSALIVVAAGLTAASFAQRHAAVRQRNLAISRDLATESRRLRASDVSLAAQLSLAAYRAAPTPTARASLLEAGATAIVTRLLGPPGFMQTVALTPDGRTMATAGADPRVRLWDTTAPGRPVALGQPLAGPTTTTFAVAFSPDGSLLAAGGSDHLVRVWDLRDRSAPVRRGMPLPGMENTVYSVAFSPDGRLLAAGGADQTVRVWDLGGTAAPTVLGVPPRGFGGAVQSVAFSPDGRLLAAGSADHTVRLWRVAAGPPTPVGPPLRGPAKAVFSVAFSPDGRTLAAGSKDRAVWLWSLADPARPVALGPPLRGPTSWVNAVAFSPDGRTLAGGSSDSLLWLWDLATRRIVVRLPHPAHVTGVAFSPDGRTLTTSAYDGIARLWGVPGPLLTGHTETVFSTTLDQTGTTLAVGSADGTTLWDVADRHHPVPLGRRLPGPPGSDLTGAAALSPDGRTLAAGANDGTVYRWDVTDPTRPVLLSPPLAGHTALVETIAFSPDGRRLATTSDDWTVRLWDVSDARHPLPLATLTGARNYTFGVAFSPDGRTVTAGSADNAVRLWDVTDLRAQDRPVVLRGPGNVTYGTAFSPDGRTLAAGTADNTVWLWDVRDPGAPRRLGTPLTGPGNTVYTVAFSADGRVLAGSIGDGSVWLWDVRDPSRPQVLAPLQDSQDTVLTATFAPRGRLLATGGANRLVRLWDADADRVAARLCASAGDGITREEWARYIPGLPYRPPCGH
jgi:WD40 repeat protein